MSRTEAMQSWARIAQALQQSARPDDQKLAADIKSFVRESPFFKEQVRQRQRDAVQVRRERSDRAPQVGVEKERAGPESER